jgi:RHS repeat-associated protein
MNQLKHALTRPRVRNHTVPLGIERLEDRLLLDGSNIFAQFSGALRSAGDAQTIPITLKASDFTLATSSTVLSFQLKAAPGSSLDPAAVQIANASGATITPRFTNADFSNNSQSVMLASLPLGNYTLTVRGDRGTSGAFQLNVFLAGDADGNFQVDTTDGNTIRNITGSVAGDGRYLVNADTNLDGLISSFDYTQWRANVGNGTALRPLYVTLQLPPGLTTLPDGSPVTASQNITVHGTTRRNTRVNLETGSDGQFDEGSTISDAAGSFAFTVSLDAGLNVLQARAADSFGQTAIASVQVTRDVQAPTVLVTEPASGLVTNVNVRVSGHVSDDLSGVASLEWAVDTGAHAGVPVNGSGDFSFSTALRLDGSGDGPHLVHLVATDRVGNVSPVQDIAFTLDTIPPDVVFGLAPESDTPPLGDDQTSFATVTLVGSTEPNTPVVLQPTCASTVSNNNGEFVFPSVALVPGANPFTVTATDRAGNVGTSQRTITRIATTLVEGTRFTVPFQKIFTVPDQPSTLSFTYEGLHFDSSADFIKDAFEASLVDAQGLPLVLVISSSRDAFFNITEGRQPVLSPNARQVGTTVSVDLSHIPAGTQATLELRLVNNDSDTTSSVTIDSVDIVPGSLGTLPGAPGLGELAPPTTPTIDFASLSDVTGSMSPSYGETSFRSRGATLFTDLALTNSGTFGVGGPLLIAIDHLSDPTVRVRGADGETPQGLPYFDYSSTLVGSILLPGQKTGTRTLEFYDPAHIQFTYDLVILGQLNRPPTFTSSPKTEALIGHSYAYQATASDPDGDVLTYSLLEGPAGMIVDPGTGRVTWSPAAANAGNQSITLRVEDGRNHSAAQHYTLSVITPPPNRPPMFTSSPAVSASVGIPYVYHAAATDPDGDAVTFGAFAHSVAIANPGFEEPALPDGSYIGSLIGWHGLGNSGTWNVTGVYSNGAPEGRNVAYANNEMLAQVLNEPVQSFTRYTLQADVGFLSGTFPGFALQLWAGGTLLAEDDSVDPAAGTFAAATLQYDSSQGAALGQPLEIRLQPLGASAEVHIDDVRLTVAPILPQGMTIDPSTGRVQWTPTAAQAHETTITVEVTDGRGGIATQLFNIQFPPPLPDQPTSFVDLTADQVDQAGLSYDGQGLTVSGTITARVSNNGSADVKKPFDVLFYEDRNGNNTFEPGTDNILGKTTVTDPIAAGTSVNVAATLSGPILFTNNRIWAFVDSGQVIAETNENNNLAVRLSEFIPPVGQFNPVVKWNKSTFIIRPDSDQVMMTPAVIDLNGDGVPDIVFATFTGASYSGGGVLRAISGDDGRELWSVDDSRYLVYPTAGIAVGDIDHDGLPEIIATATSGIQLIAFENDGTFKWISEVVEGGIFWGGPALADLDGDGSPEILIGKTMLTSDGTIRWSGTGSGAASPRGGVGPLSAVADLDLDGVPEVVAGSSAYRADGTLYWNAAIPDGFVAIGNFDSDPYPEIVVVSGDGGNLYLLEHDGTIKWGPVPIPGERWGVAGAPTVADMDGDRQPEIGVAAGEFYTVFETDGSVKWSQPIQDFSSAVTGSSVFDFEGDGQAEIVYGDERFLRIYRGSDGAVLYEVPKGSGTAYELPVIADVDGDGHAEIVAAANDYAVGNETGIFVIGDANDTWVSSRQIWNQQTYHITNVNDDGTIPAHEENSWQLYNSYRLNLQPDPLKRRIAPELTTSYVRVGDQAGLTTYTARLGNGGSLFVNPGVRISFYNGDPTNGGVLLGTVASVGRIEPGSYEDLTLTVDDTVGDLWVRADDDGIGLGHINESDETNNLYHPNLGAPPFQPGEIHGNVYNDLNGNGSLDVGSEPGFPGWTVYLDQNQNGRRDFGERLVVTVTNGVYAFTNLPPGHYFVQEEPMPGWNQTSHGNGTEVALASGQIVGGIDFGNTPSSGSPNRPPQFTSSPPTEGTAGQPLRYNASATDRDNDPLTFDLPVKPTGMTVDSTTGLLTWQPTANQVGPSDVILRVRDGRGGVDLQSFQVTVALPNTAPVITSTPPGPPVAGLPYRYAVKAQDADGDPLRYVLITNPSGMTVESLLGIVSWTPSAAQIGDEPMTVKVSDGRGGVVTQSFILSVVATATNRDPTISSTPRDTIRMGRDYRYKVDVTDPDGDPLTFLFDTAPEGMTMNASGLVSWTPTAAQFGANQVSIRVEDGRGGRALQSFTVNVVTQEVNQPPSITSTPPTHGTVGKSYAYSAVGTDPDGDPLNWSLDTAPFGMSINSDRGTILWIPQFDQIGTNAVVVRLTDAQGGETTQSFAVSVDGNVPPDITSDPPTVAVVDSVYAYGVTATDADNDPLTFRLTTAPAGMSLDPQSGLVQWTPTSQQAESQFADVAILVTDGQGNAVSQIYTIAIVSTGVNQAPQITSTPSFVAAAGQPYEYAVAATDPEHETLTYSVASLHPPALTIDANTGLLQWTPSSGDVGPLQIVVVATDPEGASASQTYRLTVTLNHPPAINSSPPLSVTAGATYRYDVHASDPDHDPLTYALVQGPAGMNVDALGRITWPTALSDLGTRHVAVRVTDTRGASTSQEFELSVMPDTEVPKVNLSITPNPVNLGDSATFVVVATDNVKVQSLQLTVNGSPVGLDSTGRATIAMHQVGPMAVVASATDTTGNTGQATDNLSVIDPSDAESPFVAIATPDAGAVITSRTSVIGTVTDNNLLFYTLEVAPFPGDTFTEIARGTTPVVNGVLGLFDPSTLLSDSYTLRLTAHDAGGHDATDERVISVAGNLKLGNFRLSFTDLAIPLAGIPITVSRTYDSLNAANQDEFGFGWRLEFGDTVLRTSVAKTGEEDDLTYNPFVNGTRVYVTLPGGHREGFTFHPQLKSGIAARFLGLYDAKFDADPGVTDQLTVPTASLAISDQGEALDYSTFLPYNPVSPAFSGHFLLTTKDGVGYTINGRNGHLEAVIDANNNTLTFTSDGIQSSTGIEVRFARDPQGRITSVIDPSGKEVKYQYDAHGDLRSVTDRQGSVTQFVYDEPRRAHYLTQVIDPLGHTGIRSEYDDQGRLIRLIDAAGKVVETIQDPDHATETVKDQLGNPTTYEYDDRGNIVTEIDALGGITKRSYDAGNNMLTETDPLGHTKSYTYDSRGDMLTDTDSLGNVTYHTYQAFTYGTSLTAKFNFQSSLPFTRELTATDPLGNTTTNEFDVQGNLLGVSDPLGHSTRFSYDATGTPTSLTDAAGNETSFEYDSAGHVVRQVDAVGHATSFTYDADGNQLTRTTTVTTPAGLRTLVTSTSYDADGRVTSMTDAEGNVTRTEYDAAGNRAAQVDALGRKTQFVYDERGKLIKTIYADNTPNDSSDNPTTQSEYDAAGHEIARIDELGRRTEMKYNALGRLIETVYPDATPGDPLDNPRTRTEYDAARQVTAQIDERGHRTEFEYDLAGRQILARDALGNVTSTTYDSAGRTIGTVDALGHTTRTVYDDSNRPVRTVFTDGTGSDRAYDPQGRLISQTDQLGRTTHYEFDAMGRLTAVVDALSQREEYSYDEAGNLISQKGANGHVTRYEYDGLSRRVAIVLPLGQRSTTSYDGAGNVAATTDFNGATIYFDYDVRDRLTAKRFPDGHLVAFDYDSAGQMLTETDARGTTTYEYDARGNLLGRTDPDSQRIVYTYDAAGNRTSVTTVAGVDSYTFDALNRTSTVTDPERAVTRYTYDADGELVKTEFPNGTVETRSYDDANHLVFLENRVPGGVIASFRYELAATGRRDAVVEDAGRRVEYSYDALDRLTREKMIDAVLGDRTISYSYDPVGNRVTRNDSSEGLTAYSYDADDRLLTETHAGQVTQYAYDDNGNRLSKVTSAFDQVLYHWGFENRLIGADVTDASGTTRVEYSYNAAGLRVASITAGEETRYLLDTVQPYAQVVMEYRPSGVITVSYVYGTGLISQDRGGSKAFYVVDGLGSTRALTSVTNSVTDRYLFDAFGQTIYRTGTTINAYLFAGEPRDAVLAIDYLRARYLDKTIGRFMSRDPFSGLLKAPQTLNKYSYTSSNPINLVDPSGKFAMTELQVAISSSVIVGTASGALSYVYERNAEKAAAVALLGAIAGFGFGLLVGPTVVSSLQINAASGLLTAAFNAYRSFNAGFASYIVTNNLTGFLAQSDDGEEVLEIIEDVVNTQIGMPHDVATHNILVNLQNTLYYVRKLSM